MSDQEVTPVEVPETQPEGVESPSADAQEVVTATTDAPKPEDDKSKRDKRMAELAFKAREAERRAKAEAERVAALEAELERARKGEGAAPKAESFETYDEYLREVTKWEIRQELAAQSKKQAEESKQAKAIEEQARKQARLQSVMDDGAQAYKDFAATLQVLDSTVANPDEIRVALDEILDSEKAADLIYYLGKNPSVLAELSQLPPNKQARKVGELEVMLKSKKLTAAPEPVQTLKGNGGRVTSDTPPTDPAKYREWRAKHMKR